MKSLFYRFNEKNDCDILSQDNNHENISNRSISSDSIHLIDVVENKNIIHDDVKSTMHGLLLIGELDEENIDLNRVHALIAAGADLSVFDEHGHTALMIAARQGYFSIVKALTDRSLPKPADINYMNRFSRVVDVNTAIMEAIIHNRVDVVAYLGSMGAHLDSRIWSLEIMFSAKMISIIDTILLFHFYEALSDGSAASYDHMMKQYGKGYAGQFSADMVYQHMLRVISKKTREEQVDALKHALDTEKKPSFFGKHVQGMNALSQYLLEHDLRNAVKKQLNLLQEGSEKNAVGRELRI